MTAEALPVKARLERFLRFNPAGKRYYLGTFRTPEAAAAIVREAREMYAASLEVS